jgi:hypothetical protein
MKIQESNPYWKKFNFVDYTKDMIKEKGILKTFFKAVIYLFDLIYGNLLFFKKKRYFLFNNVKLDYFYNKYNKTWKNERALEVPIGRYYLNKYPYNNVLEIGNVLKHYYKVKHDILDKYEYTEGILNEDVLSFKPKKKYDLILSISTMEHVGIDDIPSEPEKAVRGLINLQKNCLSSKGLMVITIPTNYNTALNKLIEQGRIENFKIYCFKRYNRFRNLWKTASFKEINNLNPKDIDGFIVLELTKNTKIKI